MTTLMVEYEKINASTVYVNDDTITIDLADGRTILAPLAWYPRLLHTNPDERNNWSLIGDGEGIH
jgi:hypothetical protein